MKLEICFEILDIHHEFKGNKAWAQHSILSDADNSRRMTNVETTCANTVLKYSNRFDKSVHVAKYYPETC